MRTKEGQNIRETERIIINDFKEIGLIYQPSNRPDNFYITPLLWNCIYGPKKNKKNEKTQKI